MKRFTMLLVAGLLAVPGVATAVCPGNWGTILGSYRGITAFSNGSDVGCISGGSSIYGYKYQCVEYTARFFGEAMHFDSAPWTGNGDQYYGSADAKALRNFPQGSTTKPKENDILCFSGGSAGHVGIITSVSSNSVTMIDQNRTTSDANDPITLSMSVVNGHYTVNSFSGSYSVQGWLRGYACDYASQEPVGTITLAPGQEQLFRAKFKNTCHEDAPQWLNDNGNHSIELRSCNSQGVEVTSFLHPVPGRPGWIDPTNRKRVTHMKETSRVKDQIATFEFWAKVPEGTPDGSYNVYFRPYHNSGQWIEEWDGMYFPIIVVNPPSGPCGTRQIIGCTSPPHPIIPPASAQAIPNR